MCKAAVATIKTLRLFFGCVKQNNTAVINSSPSLFLIEKTQHTIPAHHQASNGAGVHSGIFSSWWIRLLPVWEGGGDQKQLKDSECCSYMPQVGRNITLCLNEYCCSLTAGGVNGVTSCLQSLILGLKEIQVAQLQKYLSVSIHNRTHTETHVTHCAVGVPGYKGPVSLWFLSVCLGGSSNTHTHTCKHGQDT